MNSIYTQKECVRDFGIVDSGPFTEMGKNRAKSKSGRLKKKNKNRSR